MTHRANMSDRQRQTKIVTSRRRCCRVRVWWNRVEAPASTVEPSGWLAAGRRMYVFFSTIGRRMYVGCGLFDWLINHENIVR